MDHHAYLNFFDYANENIQHARESISQSNDLNFLEMQKERLELLVSMLNQLLLNINENNEIYHVISTNLEEIYVLLNQYMVRINQLGDEEFADVNMFISKDTSNIGKYYIIYKHILLYFFIKFVYLL
jgi:hypothetical protein